MLSNNEQSKRASGGSSIEPIEALIREGLRPKDVLAYLNPNIQVLEDEDETTLWHMIAALLEPPRRKKLSQYNTIEDAIELIKRSSKIMVVSGAGISTSAGLPDFRSRNGIYKLIHAEHPDLDDPKQMFDIEFFRTNPLPFYQFAKALYPGQFTPTIGHKFIKSIEDHDKLLRNYTQNIDTLEVQAGIKKVVECHGSFAKATCTNCGHRVTGDDIRHEILAQKVPKCPMCNKGETAPADGLGVLKPNIVFFGEQLGNEFHECIDVDKGALDLLIVIGSSMRVRPVSLIPKVISANIPQLLINREPLEHLSFDIELLGDCDHIIQELCHRLGSTWTKLCEPNHVPLRETCGPLEIRMISDDKCDVLKARHQEDVTKRNESVNLDEGSSAIVETSNQDEDEDNWEDVEIIGDSESDTASSSSSMSGDAICSILVPPASYIHVKPNKYFFSGAELTKSKFDYLQKNSS